MDNYKLHYLQVEILKKLALVTSARFNDLLIEGLESEHMNYHLKKLINFKLVEKAGNSYKLSDSGKDYTNLMDDQVEAIEKQPKTSVLLHIVRKNNDKVEHLLSRRTRQPYFGKVGRLGGKVRFGETLEQAARRELYEETGLEAGRIVLEEIYHKLRHHDDGSFVQDVIFYIFFIDEVRGSLITKTAFQKNFWISAEDALNNKAVNLFEDLDLDDRIQPLQLKLNESVKLSEGY